MKGVGNYDAFYGDSIYFTYEDAYKAAINAMSFYYQWLNGGRMSGCGSDIYFGWSEYTGNAMSDEDGTVIFDDDDVI